jgi:hypothetical protein
MFEKPLLNNGSCMFAYLAVVAQQRVYMLQYEVGLLSVVDIEWSGGDGAQIRRRAANIQKTYSQTTGALQLEVLGTENSSL